MRQESYKGGEFVEIGDVVELMVIMKSGFLRLNG